MEESKNAEFDFEKIRLLETIALAKEKLKKSRERNENTKTEIILAKKELRENTSHSISNLWSSEGFEALAELSQYANPVMDKIADFEEVEEKIQVLEMLVESPYFARIDFKFDEEDDFERIYIGRASLKKENSFELAVYDWRSPIASVFYRFVLGKAYYDAPGGRMNGEVCLKRQYEIKKGKLEYYFDSDVQIVDEFLRKLLSQNTSTKMKTIIETIQKEQDLVIRDMEQDLLMVQGVAGSGKTSIALHRAAYLMYQGLSNKLSANNILVISPNTVFEQYISNVLPELGESNVETRTFEVLMENILHTQQIQTKNQFLERLMNRKNNESLRKKSMELKTSRIFAKILNDFIMDIPQKKILFEDIMFEGKVLYTKEMLKQKVVSRQDSPLGIRLKELPDYIMDYYWEAAQEKMHRSDEVKIRNDMQNFLEIDILSLYKNFWKDQDYLKLISTNFAKTLEEVEEIARYTYENLGTGYFFHDDAIVLTYLNLKIYGTMEYRSVKQVVIDEAQDYYPLQYEILSILFQGAKFTVLGDMNQTLEKQEDISFYDQVADILHKRKSSLISMEKSFRCTNEILEFSLRFIERTPKLQSFNRHGDVVELIKSKSTSDLIEQLRMEIEKCKKMGYASIGLLCKSEKNARELNEALTKVIEVSFIKDDDTANLQGVSLMPVYMAKGLEFDAVFVCDVNQVHYHTNEDKKLLYIACTRALHHLCLVYEGEPSPFLYEETKEI